MRRGMVRRGRATLVGYIASRVVILCDICKKEIKSSWGGDFDMDLCSEHHTMLRDKHSMLKGEAIEMIDSEMKTYIEGLKEQNKNAKLPD